MNDTSTYPQMFVSSDVHMNLRAKHHFAATVKPVLSDHSKMDKTKVLKTDGSLMQVESIAECSPWSILQYFWPSLGNNRSWNQILVFFWVTA